MKNKGFTLVEMMMTIVIVSILLAWGTPNFLNIIRENRVTAKTNELITAMSLARSEAIRRGVTINVVASGGDWNNGWEIQLASDASTLRVFEPPTGTVVVAGDANSIGYLASGLPTDFDTTPIHNFTVCDSNKSGRQVRFAMGRPSVEDRQPCS